MLVNVSAREKLVYAKRLAQQTSKSFRSFLIEAWCSVLLAGIIGVALLLPQHILFGSTDLSPSLLPNNLSGNRAGCCSWRRVRHGARY